jgi:molybdopterin converting factor small subunit
MKVRVRLFAVAKQVAGRDSVELDLPEGATIAQLRDLLGNQVPSLSAIITQVMFAVGTQYANDRTRIPPGADVACIPPVSGG